MSASVSAANDQRLKKGRQTRRSILETALQLASKEGLESLSIGRLANLLDMSKSGLFAHFGSKESLQLATIEAAIDVFRDNVIRPAMKHREKGLPRLWALCNSFLDYEHRKVFGGGCFFATVTNEFKNRPGIVRDTLALRMKDWLSLITSLVQDAKDAGDLKQDVHVKQIAFEIQSLFIGGNWVYQFHHDDKAIDRAREAIRERLRQVAAPQSIRMLEKVPDLKPRNS